MNMTHPVKHGGGPLAVDLDRNPIVVFWEITTACALACRHCRAKAQPQRHPLELSTEECQRVLDELASFDHPPVVVLSGGDAFMRPDLFDLVEYGSSLGLMMSVAPSATALVTHERLQRLKDLGVSRISLSLDGSNSENHDSFRGFSGSFQRTLEAMSTAREVGLSFQVNTTVSRQTLEDLPSIANLLKTTSAVMWDLFFLVPTGRANHNDVISAEEHEQLFKWIYDIQSEVPFQVKTTLGMHYRRVQVFKKISEMASEGEDVPALTRRNIRQLYRGVATNDGRGILFISHLGDIFPSGFLPISAGNVRRDSAVDVYRESLLFKFLRDPAALEGKCGRCPFNEICGGCRARSYAITGDFLAAEPYCAFQPDGFTHAGVTPN